MICKGEITHMIQSWVEYQVQHTCDNNVHICIQKPNIKYLQQVRVQFSIKYNISTTMSSKCKIVKHRTNTAIIQYFYCKTKKQKYFKLLNQAPAKCGKIVKMMYFKLAYPYQKKITKRKTRKKSTIIVPPACVESQSSQYCSHEFYL